MKLGVGVIKEPNLELDFDNLIDTLNILCDGITFVNLETKEWLKDRIISRPESFLKVKKRIKNNKKFDWTIYLTEKPYNNNYFYDELNTLLIISFYGWEDLTTLPKNNGLIYFICALLAETLDASERHYINTGCIFDYLVDKTGIDMGMRKASICPDCYHRISGNQKEAKDLLLLSNLSILMRELSNASIWNQDFIKYWKTKSNELNGKGKKIIYKIENRTNNFEEIIDSIKELELEKAIMSLERIAAANIKSTNTLIILSANWNDLKNKEIAGVVDMDTYIKLRNRIVLSILEILNELKMKK